MWLESKEWAKDHRKDILQFVNSMWFTKATENERVWTSAADGIIDSVEPGFMFQNLSYLSYHDEHNLMRVFQVKTLVLWGRAYIGMLGVDDQVHFNGQTVVFLRDEDPDGCAYHNPFARTDLFFLHRLFDSLPSVSWSWIFKEGHFACVWKLAERVAKVMAIEHVQVDIFIVRGHPTRCLVGDLSLYTRENFGSHMGKVARLWAEPLLSENYNCFGNESSEPFAYDFTETIPERPEGVTNSGHTEQSIKK